MQVYVGQFSEADIDSGRDKICVAEAQKRTGLKYINTQLIKTKNVIAGIRIWVCDLEDMRI